LPQTSPQGGSAAFSFTRLSRLKDRDKSGIAIGDSPGFKNMRWERVGREPS
jgi:hypothetical protein